VKRGTQCRFDGNHTRQERTEDARMLHNLAKPPLPGVLPGGLPIAAARAIQGQKPSRRPAVLTSQPLSIATHVIQRGRFRAMLRLGRTLPTCRRSGPPTWPYWRGLAGAVETGPQQLTEPREGRSRRQSTRARAANSVATEETRAVSRLPSTFKVARKSISRAREYRSMTSPSGIAPTTTGIASAGPCSKATWLSLSARSRPMASCRGPRAVRA